MTGGQNKQERQREKRSCREGGDLTGREERLAGRDKKKQGRREVAVEV